MAERRKRSQRFTLEEKDKLVKLVSTYKDTILSNKFNATANKSKIKAWTAIAAKFNSGCGLNYRPRHSLLRVWEKLKAEAKVSNSGQGVVKFDRIYDPVYDKIRMMLESCHADKLNVNDSDTAVSEENFVPNVTIKEEFQSEETNVGENTSMNEFQTSASVERLGIDDEDSGTIWPRRNRSAKSYFEENIEASRSSCSSFGDGNKKRSKEDLEHQILIEELEFKRQLHRLQLESAAQNVKIKAEILTQIKSGRLSLRDLLNEDLLKNQDKIF